MHKKTLDHLLPDGLDGIPVLVRADLNVPLDGDRVTDDTRVRASLPTLEALSEAGARILLLSHLGRPKGGPDAAFTLKPVARLLDELLEGRVVFADASTGASVAAAARELAPGRVLLLENTRFEPGETSGSPELSAEWAALAAHFVNDAFGSAHRAHASTTGVAEAIRNKGGMAVAGRLMAKELDFLGKALGDPRRPFLAILGGAKISGKIDVIEALLPRVERLLVGGAMANTFFLALGLPVGRSLVEHDRLDVARDLLARAGDRLMLPVDCVVVGRIEAGATPRVVARDDVGPEDIIADIGPATRAAFAAAVKDARTVIWNGPMGVFEVPELREGTVAVARAVAEATDRGALTVVGGGDSAAAAEAAGVTGRLSHVSTGGGASLEFLAGVELPGVAALSDI
jgi:phosphoglycerate kinase